MSMSVGDCTSRVDNGYQSYLNDIYDNFSSQKDQFDQEEAKRKEEYDKNNPPRVNNAQNIGIKSSIPAANQTKESSEPYISNTFTFNQSIKKFFQMLADEMDVEFQKATPSQTNVDITTPAGTLTYEEQDDVVQNAYEIGTKTAAYWALTIMPTGIPVVGTITTVTNTAMSIASPLAQEILSIASNEQTGTFKKIVDVIIKHVKTITWTVIELDKEQKPVTFTVTVS